MTALVRESVRLRGLWVVRKYLADDDLARTRPYEVVEAENMVTDAGAQAFCNRLANQGAVTAFDATSTRLCVGNGTTPPAGSQTDLTGGTKTRKIVDAAPTVSGRGITWIATFTVADANHAWTEAGIANAASGGVLLNRVQQDFGTKTSSVQWVLTGAVTYL